MRSSRGAGRPPATSRAHLADVGLRLFIERGFNETTVDDIAAAAGIARRTFFLYYRSKNDVVYGDFEAGLEAMAALLAAVPAERDVLDAVREAVVAFNQVPDEVTELHRARMRLILHVPALQAHSTLRYAAWRDVVARHVALRLGADERSLVPQVVAHTALGAALAAYEQWLADPGSDLPTLLTASLDWIADPGVLHSATR